ncbi:MAG: hypothetical protein RMJ98_21900, partial [Myxococcales bacterium]|nr:hypothetical protein [Polyangiaceae bacterium]MDW8251959.1 hypothetical protein [Myxococcales bacterium]
MHFLLVLVFLAACDRGTSPQAMPSALTSTTQAPSLTPPSSALPQASVAPGPPVPTAIHAVRMQTDSPGRKPLPLTLLRTEPNAGSALLNEETGELLVVQEVAEGGVIRISSPVLSAALTVPEETRPGALQIQGGPRIPLRRYSPPPAKARVSPPQEVLFVTPDGAEIKISPAERAGHLLYEKSGETKRPDLLYRGRWLSASAPRSQPTKIALGPRLLEGQPLAPDRSLGCQVHGVIPAMNGELGPVVEQAWRNWARDHCLQAGKDGVIELSYTAVKLAGVSRLCETLAVNERPGAVCSEPPSGIHLPINLQARVTCQAGIVLVEEALLLDTKQKTLHRLTSLATPKVAEVLRQWLPYELVAPP